MNVKRLVTMSTAVFATAIVSAMPVMASGWQQNSTGWWYGTNADNSTWYANGWQWIDGNGDGTAECYYFNQNGYALMNTTTPDGYSVDNNGAWLSAGKVQTKVVSNADSTVQQEGLSGIWSGYDQIMGQTITYEIDGSNIIEYTIDNECIVPSHAQGSTTFTRNGNVLQLGKTENVGYLAGNGKLKYENGNLIATDWGEDGSYEVVYTRQ